MRIGGALVMIALGAILTWAVTVQNSHGFNINTIGVILMVVGALGVVLWLIIWAPWGTRARSRRTVYRDEVPPDVAPPTYRRTVYREEVPPDEVPPPRRYPTDGPY